jgi:hypothetical protein
MQFKDARALEHRFRVTFEDLKAYTPGNFIRLAISMVLRILLPRLSLTMSLIKFNYYIGI